MKTYFIIDIETGEVVRQKAYLNAKDAKLALKYHFNRRNWGRLGIASIEYAPVLEWVTDERGKWTEVFE